jgi:hypothetical protein
VFKVRARALDTMLARGERDPALFLSSKCQMIRAGLLGRYHIARVRSGAQQGNLPKVVEPVKNEYSHPVEALQYVCLGIQGLPRDEQSNETARLLAAYNEGLRPMDPGAGY